MPVYRVSYHVFDFDKQNRELYQQIKYDLDTCFIYGFKELPKEFIYPLYNSEYLVDCKSDTFLHDLILNKLKNYTSIENNNYLCLLISEVFDKDMIFDEFNGRKPVCYEFLLGINKWLINHPCRKLFEVRSQPDKNTLQ